MSSEPLLTKKEEWKSNNSQTLPSSSSSSSLPSDHNAHYIIEADQDIKIHNPSHQQQTVHRKHNNHINHSNNAKTNNIGSDSKKIDVELSVSKSDLDAQQQRQERQERNRTLSVKPPKRKLSSAAIVGQLSEAVDNAFAVRLDRNLAILNVVLLLLSFCVVILIVATNEKCFDGGTLVWDSECDVERASNIIEWFFTLISVLVLCKYYQLLANEKKRLYHFTSTWTATIGSTLILKFLAEVALHFLLPMPWFHDAMTTEHQILTVLPFLRSYQVVRLIRDSAVVYRMRHIFANNMSIKNTKSCGQSHVGNVPVHYEVSTFAVLKTYFFNYTATFVIVLCVWVGIILSYFEYLMERHYWIPIGGGDAITGDAYVLLDLTDRQKYSPSKLSSYWNGIWFVVVTMTTAGYGDIYPVSSGGRVVAMLAAILGIINTSLIVGVVTNKLNPSAFEAYLITWNQRDKLRREKEYLSARLLQTAWRYYKFRRSKKMTFIDPRRSFQAHDQALLFTRAWIKRLQRIRIRERQLLDSLKETTEPEPPVTDSKSKLETRIHEVENQISLLHTKMDRIINLLEKNSAIAQSGGTSITSPTSPLTSPLPIPHNVLPIADRALSIQ